jgi:hypothetical protein
MVYFRIFAGWVGQAFVPGIYAGVCEDPGKCRFGQNISFRFLQPDLDQEHLIWCVQDWPWQQVAGPDWEDREPAVLFGFMPFDLWPSFSPRESRIQ